MKTIIKRDRKVLEDRRIKAGKLFAKGKTQAEVAKKYAVTGAAACKWYAVWRKKGEKGLVSKGKPGKDPQLSDKKKEKLKQILLEGPKKSKYQTDFWTLERIRLVAKKRLHVELGQTSIWRTVIDLGFSCQKPEKRAKERNEKAIGEWKLTEFPKLKKMGQAT